MGETAYKLNGHLDTIEYAILLELMPKLRGLSLDDITKQIEPSLSERLVRDGRALEVTATEEASRALESRLLSHLRQFNHDYSYTKEGSQRVKKIYEELIDYIKFLRQLFQKADDNKVNHLKGIIIKTVMHITNYMVWVCDPPPKYEPWPVRENFDYV